jgi:hypothetical protein
MRFLSSAGISKWTTGFMVFLLIQLKCDSVFAGWPSNENKIQLRLAGASLCNIDNLFHKFKLLIAPVRQVGRTRPVASQQLAAALG